MDMTLRVPAIDDVRMICHNFLDQFKITRLGRLQKLVLNVGPGSRAGLECKVECGAKIANNFKNCPCLQDRVIQLCYVVLQLPGASTLYAHSLRNVLQYEF